MPVVPGVDGISRYSPCDGVEACIEVPRIAPSDGASIEALAPLDGAKEVRPIPSDGVSHAFCFSALFLSAASLRASVAFTVRELSLVGVGTSGRM